MPETGLRGPYALDNQTIDREVTRTSPGAYALDRFDTGTFYVYYVGRSDENINQRLKQWVGIQYRRFMFTYFESAKTAFDKECNLWHDFGGPEGKGDNKVHPDRSQNADWKCPRCDRFT